MTVLVVESSLALRRIWTWHLIRQDLKVAHVGDDSAAIEYLAQHDVDVILLSLNLEDGSSFAVSDYASYRRPNAKIICVTRDSFFSDGSIFQHCQNACAIVPEATNPVDLATMASHYANG